MTTNRLLHASAVAGRIALAAVATFLLISVPTNVATWGDVASTVIPTQRTMPPWGNYLLGLVMLATLISLTLGALLRRRISTPGRGLWSATAWIALLGLGWWTAALLVSQVRALDRDGLTSTVAPGIYTDGVFAVVAFATMAMIAGDMRAIARLVALTEAAQSTRIS